MTIFKDIFSGDLFRKGLVINNTPFLAYITLLMILYVAYGYHVDSVVMIFLRKVKKQKNSILKDNLLWNYTTRKVYKVKL